MVVTYNGSKHFNAAGKKVQVFINDPPDDPQLLPAKI